MSDKKKEKFEKRFVEAGWMEADDNIVAYLQANACQRLSARFGKWVQGWIYFTERRLVYPIGFLGLADTHIIIPYKNIRKLEKCRQGLFPIGIAITHEHWKDGMVVTDKISLMKREKWMQFMAEKAGCPLS